MIASFLMVGKQVLILFIVVGAGFVLGKSKLLGEKASVGMTNLVIYVVSPCMMVVAFQRPFDSEYFHNFCTALVIAVAIHLLNIAAVTLFLRDSDLKRQQALRFGTVLSNCGFMAYPLQTALLGTIGVFYGSAYVLVFTVTAWTYGLYLMSGGKGKFSLKPLLLNPGVISVAVASLLYVLRISLPDILYTPVEYLSHLNTPLPMIILGYQLSQADFKPVLRCRTMWISAAMRLLLLPAAALGLCLLFRPAHDVAIATVAAASTPPAALLSMFAAKFGQDTALSSGVVSLQTLFSVLTIPVIVGFAMTLF